MDRCAERVYRVLSSQAVLGMTFEELRDEIRDGGGDCVPSSDAEIALAKSVVWWRKCAITAFKL
jgi:hypothetical protein